MNPTHTIPLLGSTLVASIVLSSCAFGGDSGTAEVLPEPIEVPGRPATSTSPALEPDESEDRGVSSVEFDAIQGVFAVGISLGEIEARCLATAGPTISDYRRLLHRGAGEPTDRVADALDTCLTDRNDRALGAWIAMNRLDLDDPSECLAEGVGASVVDIGWVDFIDDVVSRGYDALEEIVAGCDPPAKQDQERAEEPQETPEVSESQQAELLAGFVTAQFGLDPSAKECLTPRLSDLIAEHGPEQLRLAFGGDVSEFDLNAPPVVDLYRALGVCAPLAGSPVEEPAVVGMIRSMGATVDREAQQCLAYELDGYASRHGTAALFAAFEDIAGDTRTEGAYAVAVLINGCMRQGPELADVTDPDVAVLSTMAANLNGLDGTQADCLDGAMPGIVERYGYDAVHDSLVGASGVVGHGDEILDDVTLAAIGCL